MGSAVASFAVLPLPLSSTRCGLGSVSRRCFAPFAPWSVCCGVGSVCSLRRVRCLRVVRLGVSLVSRRRSVSVAGVGLRVLFGLRPLLRLARWAWRSASALRFSFVDFDFWRVGGLRLACPFFWRWSCGSLRLWSFSLSVLFSPRARFPCVGCGAGGGGSVCWSAVCAFVVAAGFARSSSFAGFGVSAASLVGFVALRATPPKPRPPPLLFLAVFHRRSRLRFARAALAPVDLFVAFCSGMLDKISRFFLYFIGLKSCNCSLFY